MAVKTAEERRQTGRVQLQGRVEIAVAHRATPVSGNSVNLSEGGLCVRLEESLDVKSPVTLKLFPQPRSGHPATLRSRPVECAGRVAWVVQRSDLRAAPPFVYDVGVEFVRTSARLRQVASKLGVVVRAPLGAAKPTSLDPVTARGRTYEPRVLHAASPHGAWHLVIQADGAPCLSRHFTSEREAVAGWNQYKRQLRRGKRSGR